MANSHLSELIETSRAVMDEERRMATLHSQMIDLFRLQVLENQIAIMEALLRLEEKHWEIGD